MSMTKNFSGRSMIEMLGVLAIIGVLSLGGLAGYKIAMNYHRANETIHDVMLRATNVPMKWDDYASKTKNFEFAFNDMGAYKTNNPVGYPVKVYAEGPNSASGYAFRVEVDGVPSEVCKRINNMNPSAVDKIEPLASGCGDATADMIFYFDEDFKCVGPDCGSSSSSSSSSSGSSSSSSSSSGGGCSLECNECETCEGSTCVPKEENTACSNDGKCNGNGHCCQNIKTEAECTSECKLLTTDTNGCAVCSDSDCFEPRVCNNGSCECPEGTPSGADDATCECPTPTLPEGANGEGCYELKDEDADDCNEYVFKCGDLGCKTDGSACCPELTLPEGATSDACYTATDTDSDGCNDTYVLNCGDLGCKSDYSACCTTPAATDCGNCQKPEVGSDGCYTGGCRACTEEENCTYEFGTTGKDSTETAILKCFEDYCFCTEMDLFYCSSGQAAYTICCNPNAAPGCSGLGCQPKDFWMNLDASDECINTVSGGPELDEDGLPIVDEETTQYSVT